MPTIAFYLVDVFAEQKYCGNPLAVCIDTEGLSTTQMQQIAKEINFSETTFVDPAPQDDGSYKVRIFTPVTEIPFAGHPTLGTAHIIKTQLCGDAQTEVTLALAAGNIPVQFNANGMAWMQQNPPEFFATHPIETFAAMLGVTAEDIDSRFAIEEVSTGFPFFIVPMTSLAAVKKAALDKALYANYIATTKAKAVFIFCAETYGQDNDFNARMFAPHYGIEEDAATGSANGCFAAYLVKHRYTQQPSINARVEQGMEMGRPSVISINAQAALGLIDVSVGGNCVDIAHGKWRV